MLLAVVIPAAVIPAWVFGLGLVVCLGAVVVLSRKRGGHD